MSGTRCLAAVLVLLAAMVLPAGAQLFDPGDLIRIILTRPRVETVPSGPPPAPPPPWNGSRDLPEGYGILVQDTRACRLAHLPFCVYNGDARFQAHLAHAVTAWNEAGRLVGVDRLLEIVTVPEGADVRVEWNRQGLPEEAAAAVWWNSGAGYRRVLGVTVDPDPRLPPGNLAQVLMQELGHVVGLDHSEDPADLMHGAIHTRRYDRLDGARPSGRDVQALAFLYDRVDFVSIVGLRDPGPPGAGGAPSTGTPGGQEGPGPPTPVPTVTPIAEP